MEQAENWSEFLHQKLRFLLVRFRMVTLLQPGKGLNYWKSKFCYALSMEAVHVV